YADQGIVRRYYAWISEAIPGESLSHVMVHEPERLQAAQMDMESFSQLFLFTYLTCPEDGQPENFIVQRTLKNKTRQIAIDYGQCFVQAESSVKSWYVLNTQVLTIKTMIYLLDAMDAPANGSASCTGAEAPS